MCRRNTAFCYCHSNLRLILGARQDTSIWRQCYRSEYGLEPSGCVNNFYNIPRREASHKSYKSVSPKFIRRAATTLF